MALTDQRREFALEVYVGLYGAQGNFQAYLSDFSAAPYIDSSQGSIFGNAYAEYTVNFTAASADQTLLVRYTAKTLYDADFGNVTLQSATLSGGPAPTNSPPSVEIISPANNATFTAPANVPLVAAAFDSDGTISSIEFFNGADSLGYATPSSSLTWSNVSAGLYILSALATDNLGATAISSPVAVSVAPGTNSAVTILNAAIDGGQFRCSFQTQNGVNYTVQFTDSLLPAGWQTLTNLTGNGSSANIADGAQDLFERFYRVQTQ